MASPIQIILNPENYEEARETSGGGPKKDFFANRDQDFENTRHASSRSSEPSRTACVPIHKPTWAM